MKDVKKQHMNVACDMADKLNLISLRESELKTKLKETEEEKERELELIKSEWNELENKYKEEILAWQKNAEKQSYVIHQLQIHFEQAQHLIYEKDVEITEMQRIISVLQEKSECDKNTNKINFQTSEMEFDKEVNVTENERYKIMPEDILQNQIQHLNEQLEATKLCLKTSRSETAKYYQKEIEYYNDIIQKKENHIKRLQMENTQFRAGVEGKEAVILKQRKEIRQFNARLQRLEKDLRMKEEIIKKLKNRVDFNISQTEQEKLSTIGTRCLEERHQQRLEEFQNRISQIEDGLYSIDDSKENFDMNILNPLNEWKHDNHSFSTGNLEVIQEQPFNEIFLYDTIKQCEETYLNLINSLAHSLGITELEGAVSLAIVPHMEWNVLIKERKKDHKRFINAIEVLKTLAQNELVDQEEHFRSLENQLHAATHEINRLKEENKLKMRELKEAEKILKLTRRSLERERLINLAIKQNRKKLEQLTAKIILQKEDDMLKVEENIKKKRKEISKTEEKLENIESKLAADAKVKKT
ncbi:putative leucine-rich repeat-containing protein DDB_G0290503 isoform X2 [Centruroides vittatus]